jgi:DNA polymerase V
MLKNKPTVVVSSAGGIILARSNEVKALGIPMGAPVFKVKELLMHHKVTVIPANFALYAETSARIETILHEMFPLVEDYSIDESFVLFPDQSSLSSEEIKKQCSLLRAKISKWTDIPVSVGIATTKTLAKVAVKLAKKEASGVVALTDVNEIDKVLKVFPIADIWGVGRALSPKLPAYGINTAYDLVKSDVVYMRKRFSVALAFTINELRGEACITLNNVPAPAKSTAATGTFDVELTTKADVEHALHGFARRAALHLRKANEVAGGIVVFVRGNRFKKDKASYVALQSVGKFSPATSYTPTLLKFVSDSMDKLFFEGASIKRMGIYLFDLLPKEHRQLNLFEDEQKRKSMNADDVAMKTIDSINKKWKRRKELFTIKI